MSEELKPCPFCTPEDSRPMCLQYENSSGFWHVFCFYCGAQASGEDTEAKAIRAWNSRPSSEEREAGDE